MRACAACGTSLEGRRANARTCSDRCRDRLKKRAQRGSVVALPPVNGAAEAESPVVVALTRELEEAGRLETTEGQHALFLCRRLAAATQDTGSGVASLSKEYRTAKAEALKGAATALSAVDELRRRRDAKRGA